MSGIVDAIAVNEAGKERIASVPVLIYGAAKHEKVGKEERIVRHGNLNLNRVKNTYRSK